MKLLGRKGTLWMQYIIIIISFLILSLANISKNVELYLNFICRFATSAIELVFYTSSLLLSLSISFLLHNSSIDSFIGFPSVSGKKINKKE